jgi:hypothetical protein
MAFDLTVASGAYNASGKFGSSLNGGNAYTTTCPFSAYPFTLQAWVKASATGNIEVAAGRASCGWFGKAANNTALAHYGSGNAGTTDGSDITLASSVNIADGAWHFLELDVTANGGAFFVDGVLVSSSTAKPTFPGQNQYFGVRAFFSNTNSSTASFNWTGEIDEVALFNSALHTVGYTPPTSAYTGSESGLLALYHFDGNGTNSQVAAAPTAPGAPTIGTATAGDGYVDVAFTAPASDGGATITSYTATLSTGETATGTTSPIRVTAANGTARTGHVTATNSVNTGPASAESNSVTPTAAPQPVQLAYNDANVRWSPFNWDDRTSYKSTNNPGAYLKLGFTGTSVAVKVDVSAMSGASLAAGSYPIVRTVIDGTSFVDTQLTSATTSVSRTGLAAGSHTLEMYFLAADINNGDRWVTPVNAIRVTGFTLDTGASASAVTARSKTMLFYGDSINEGYLANGTVTTQPAGNNCMTTVAPTLAQALDCEYGVVAFSGQGYAQTGNNGVPFFPNAYNLYSSGRSRLVNGLLSPQPDYILVEHGANLPSSVTSAMVQSMIVNMRAMAPNAKIFQMVPAGGFARTAITAGFTAAADANAYLIDLGTSYQTGISGTGSGNMYSLDGLHRNPLSNLRAAAGFTKKVQAALDNVVVPTLTQRTVTKQFKLDLTTLAANLTGLKVSFFDESSPELLTVPRYQAAGKTTDASGNLSFSFGSTLASGGTGWLDVRGAGVHFCGPVAVA